MTAAERKRARDERIAAIMAEATARDRAQRAAALARRTKASGGLPLPVLGSTRTTRGGSIARVTARSTRGKIL